MQNFDVIVIGSGIGGLCAGSLLARYGKKVIICESHTIAGGAAHCFRRQGFTFDSGPSFYCGLTTTNSLNPVKQVLDVLGESLSGVNYDPLGYYHLGHLTFPVYSNSTAYLEEVAKITTSGAKELENFQKRLLPLYNAMKGIPALALRGDWQSIFILLKRYPEYMLKMLPHLSLVRGSVGDVMDGTIKDPWVRQLIDLECFLLSGLKAKGTIAPEVAFMLGERSHTGVEYPLGGSEAIVNALVRGFERWGGVLRLGSHVKKILIENGKTSGVLLKNGKILLAPIVISNASIWDTYTKLLKPEDLPKSYRQSAASTPAVESFMHLHLGIRAQGLENLTGHHVVVHEPTQDITTPGNTCMISIPSVWDAELAPSGHHVIHAYTLEPYAKWKRDQNYQNQKHQKAQTLYRAIERVIPDIRDRVVLELIGTPLTHAHYLRRYQGTYGPAISPQGIAVGIAAGKGSFPSNQTPIKGLYRVGDSTMPGIGVPAVAASGILCANALVKPQQTLEILKSMKN